MAYIPRKDFKVQIVSPADLTTIDMERTVRDTYGEPSKPVAVMALQRAGKMAKLFGSYRGGLSTSEKQSPITVTNGSQLDQFMNYVEIVDRAAAPILITDGTRVPNQIKVGQDVEIQIASHHIPDKDAKLMAMDKRSTFIISRKGDVSEDGRCWVSVQAIGSSNDAAYASLTDLLRSNRFLNYVTNIKGEASRTHEGLFTPRRYRYYNHPETTRHGYDITGHAASDRKLDRLYGVYANTDGALTGLLPVNQQLLEEHVEAIMYSSIYSQSNYSVKQQKFLNKVHGNGIYVDRFSTSGLLEQMEQTPWTFDYSVSRAFESPKYFIERVKGALSQLRKLTGGQARILALGGYGAEKVWSTSMAAYNIAQGINYHQNISPDSQSMITAGIIVNAIRTEDGEAMFFNYEEGISEGVFEPINYGSYYGEDLRSFDMFFIPLMNDLENGNASFRMHFKGREVNGLGNISRALVPYSTRGVIGLGTGIASLDDAYGRAASIFGDASFVGDLTDAMTMGLLTEFMPMCSVLQWVQWGRATE